MAFFRSHVLVSVDPECLSRGAHEVIDALHDELVAQGLIDEVQVLETSRIGDPVMFGPDLMVYPEGVHYACLTADDIPYLVEEHFLKGRPVEKFRAQERTIADEELGAPTAKEVRVVLRNCGKIDPNNIEDYIAEDGYLALGQVLTEMSSEQVIDTVLASGLAGRGGAGFPAGKKWQFARASAGDVKYVICNADEGDPGAFMNRRVLEVRPPRRHRRHDHRRLRHRLFAGLHLLPCRISHRRQDAQHRHQASTRIWLPWPEHPRHRLQLRSGSSPGRRRICLRRRDSPDGFDRRKAW